MEKRFFESPFNGDFGSTSIHSMEGSVSSSMRASARAAQASMEQCEGKFPRKKAVSTTTPRITPGTPNRTMAQSCPATRFRRLSQPSIHLPRSVYSCGRKTASAGLRRFSFSAKKSSLAAITAPRRRSEARSISSVKGACVMSV